MKTNSLTTRPDLERAYNAAMARTHDAFNRLTDTEKASDTGTSPAFKAYKHAEYLSDCAWRDLCEATV
jgi:hypothetical protein